MKSHSNAQNRAPIRTLYLALIAACLMFFVSSALAHPGQIKVNPSQFKATNMGSCEQNAESITQYNHSWSDETALWQLEVLSPLVTAETTVFYLESAFYFESATQLPGLSAWTWHKAGHTQVDPNWPAYLAVYTIDKPISVGDIILVCNSAKLAFAIKAGISTEAQLRKSVLTQVRVTSLTEGTLFAMTLAALGLALMIQRLTFIMFAAGMSMALLFVMVNNGTLLELPGGYWLLREWHIQRIAGISASMMIGWGLARFLGFKERHPILWPILLLLFGLIGTVLLLSIIPNPLIYSGISHYSNALMVGIIVMILGSALAGLWQGHRASMVLLLSWGPVLIMTVWLGATSYVDSVWTAAARWLYPATLVYACSFLFTELARNISQTQAQRDVAHLRAKTDHLTGAMTRGELDRRLELVHASALKGGADFALLFIDFDHFKQVNDNFGHAAGDAALIAAIQRIKSILRNDDSVGRYGGEEFVVILEGIKAKSAQEIADRICTDIANDGQAIDKGLPPITVSIGVASYKHNTDRSIVSLIERADSALFAAKQQGRNRVVIDS
ncbi:diguanylate cyclase [Glaciecola sp. SC05]|uniref:sensor domain-containing diguanylate cyclase n=1 Tax=Glaciecola sp. SC05 TaxID=1987355 RepID=UPI003528B61A